RISLLFRYLRAGRSGIPALAPTARGGRAAEGVEDPQWPLLALPGAGPGRTPDVVSDLVDRGADPLEQSIPDLVPQLRLQGATARHRIQRAAGLVGAAVRGAGDADTDPAQCAGHAGRPESAGTVAGPGTAGEPAAGPGTPGARKGARLTPFR